MIFLKYENTIKIMSNSKKTHFLPNSIRVVKSVDNIHFSTINRFHTFYISTFKKVAIDFQPRHKF